jgi:hypothetical protein
MFNLRYTTYIFLLLTYLIVSCKKKENKGPKWKTEILTPLVTSSMSMMDFLPDSIYKTNADSSISMVYSVPLYTLALDSLVKLDIPPFSISQKVQSLKINSDTIEYKITLGEMARQLIAEGESMGQEILNAHGSNYIIPNINNQSIGPFPLDFSDILNSATILSGDLSLEIINDFPVGFFNVQMILNNKVGGQEVIVADVGSLPRYSNYGPVHFDLAGKSIEGVVDINISKLSLSSGYQLIDTNAIFITRLVISDLIVDEAWAVFPDQELISKSEDTPLQNMGEVKLTKAALKTGNLRLKATSSASERIFYDFSVPMATKNGVPFRATGSIPPSNAGTPGQLNLNFDFSGYKIDLRGSSGNSYNVIKNTIKAYIQKSGQPVYISHKDSIAIDLAFENVKPSYVEGFLGREIIPFGPEEVEFELFKDFNVGEVSFKELNITMDFENGIGIDGFLDIEKLTASNASQTHTIQNVAAGKIAKAQNNPYKVSYTTITANGSSRPEELLNLKPNKIGYVGKVHLNKDVNEFDLSGFAYDTSTIKATANMVLPLYLTAKKFVLADTINFKGNTIDEPIGSGSLNLLAYNGYPLDASVEFVFLDEKNQEIDRLVSGRELLAASIDPQSGKVLEKKYSKLIFPLDLERLNKILKAPKVVFISTFWTMPENQHVKIYSDYTIELKLVGDFEYIIKKK